MHISLYWFTSGCVLEATFLIPQGNQRGRLTISVMGSVGLSCPCILPFCSANQEADKIKLFTLNKLLVNLHVHQVPYTQTITAVSCESNNIEAAPMGEKC